MPSSSRPPGILFFSINGNGLGQRAALGLERDGRCVLLSLGPGNVKDVSGIGPELIAALRHRDALAREAQPALARRYDPRPPAESLGPYQRARRLLGQGLRRLGLLSPLVVEPWLPGCRAGGGASCRGAVPLGAGNERARTPGRAV